VGLARLTVEPAAARARLDRWLATQFPELSRARLQSLIETGRVLVDGQSRKAAHRLRGGEAIEVDVAPPPPETLAPEPGVLAIVYEDQHVIVIDKPAGAVVHPGAGHDEGTLVAAVLAHAPEIAAIGGARRPGVVHRLDKGTSGLLVIAKSLLAYRSLTTQLVSHAVSRTYVAVVHGMVAREQGVVDAPIGRHPTDRVRMAIRPGGQGKRAVTRFRVLERFARFTYLELSLETGRTHQIRVHLASLGHPVVGDETYGGGKKLRSVPADGIALHAVRLAFTHPEAQNLVTFSSPIPRRIEFLLCHLRSTR
jgi:23S rRNA pseudouridine1911/1915/1917 synthase